MPDLKTRYMGFELDNPIIAGSSILTGAADKVKKLEDAGIGAVVLKSIFEEQIMSEADKMIDDSSASYHPEALDYISRASSQKNREEYLTLIKDCKEKTSLPIIASLNCVSRESWIDYAAEIESAGADGLELNMYLIPKDHKEESGAIEQMYIDIFKDIKAKVKLPIALKIGSFFTNLYSLADKLEAQGVSALVLFNRFYRYTIDTDSLELKHGSIVSSSVEVALTLRWMMLMAGRYDLDLAATTGIHDGDALIQQLLAGATAVQVASTLYLSGQMKIGEMKKDLSGWMDKHGFASIDDFRGKLSQAQSDNPRTFERFQYIKALVGIE